MTLNLPYSAIEFNDDAKNVFGCFIARIASVLCRQVEVTSVIARESLKQSGGIDVKFEVVDQLVGSGVDAEVSAQARGNTIITALDNALAEGEFAYGLNQLMVDNEVQVPSIEGSDIVVVSAATVEIEMVGDVDIDAEGGTEDEASAESGMGGIVAGVAVGGMLVGAAAILVVRRKKHEGVDVSVNNESGGPPKTAAPRANANAFWGDNSAPAMSSSTSASNLTSARDLFDSMGEANMFDLPSSSPGPLSDDMADANMYALPRSSQGAPSDKSKSHAELLAELSALRTTYKQEQATLSSDDKVTLLRRATALKELITAAATGKQQQQVQHPHREF